MPLAKVAGAVAAITQNIAVQGFDSLRRRSIRVAGCSKASACQSTEDRGATDPANGMADTCIVKSCALSCQCINVGRLYDWVAIASQRAGGLVVSEEKYDVRRLFRFCFRSITDVNQRMQ